MYIIGEVVVVLFLNLSDAGATWNELADTGNGNVNKILINPNQYRISYFVQPNFLEFFNL